MLKTHVKTHVPNPFFFLNPIFLSPPPTVVVKVSPFPPLQCCFWISPFLWVDEMDSLLFIATVRNTLRSNLIRTASSTAMRYFPHFSNTCVTVNNTETTRDWARVTVERVPLSVHVNVHMCKLVYMYINYVLHFCAVPYNQACPLWCDCSWRRHRLRVSTAPAFVHFFKCTMT